MVVQIKTYLCATCKFKKSFQTPDEAAQIDKEHQEWHAKLVFDPKRLTCAVCGSPLEEIGESRTGLSLLLSRKTHDYWKCLNSHFTYCVTHKEVVYQE